MKCKMKMIVVTMLTCISIIFQGVAVFASDVSQDFKSYEDKLAELNLELGTSYQFTPAVGESYDEMVSFFQNMSLSEFEKYIRECYAAEIEFDNAVDSPQGNIVSNGNQSRSTLDTQKFFYAGNYNYLFIKAYTTIVAGTTIYTGDIASAGYSISTYPGYGVSSYSKEFDDDMRTVQVTYHCTKYLSKYITDAVAYTLEVSFVAGAGDMYIMV